MQKFARLIGEGMHSRGHSVEYWSSPAILSGVATRRKRSTEKWLRYADQFLLYPPLLASRVRAASHDSLFVVTDQALGMWVPRLAHRPHVIHCHDLLALRSSLGEFRENPISWTGRHYQRLIRKGFAKGRHFICDSHKTHDDLQRFMKSSEQSAQVVHIGLNDNFSRMPESEAFATLGNKCGGLERRGILLHVGGNVWYKNRPGVVELYKRWCSIAKTPVLPLWMVGPRPSAELVSNSRDLPRGGLIKFQTNLSPAELRATYCLARLLLFPSLEEGFGWPIAEALACGCRVLTTGHAPMTEVGGEAAYYLPRLNGTPEAWADLGAQRIDQILETPIAATKSRIELGYEHARTFDTRLSLAAYEHIYQSILNQQLT